MSNYSSSDDPNARPVKLTPAELEVIVQIAKGKSNKQIANSRRTSPATVQTQVHVILEKLALPNRAAAAVYALRKGLIASDGQGQPTP